jgi:hypothetical protein
MSVPKIIAIVTIFLIGCMGWFILGTVTAFRSDAYFSRLEPKVEALWGSPLIQRAPAFTVQIPGSSQVRWIMPSKNEITVEIQPDYRKKGLIWYPTYICSFEGSYTITNTEEVLQKIRLHFSFPAKGATYDNFAAYIDKKLLLTPVDTKLGLAEIIELAPGRRAEFKIKYETRGIESWQYQMDQHVGRIQNLKMLLKTGFRNVDYTEGSLSPMSTNGTEDGMILKWEATDLITNSNIGIAIPQKLNPGPLTSRITYFAPVCLIFFFVLIATLNIKYAISIHPMHYLFVAAGFFAFHLLLTYFVGHINVHLAFLISALTSVTLVTSYLINVHLAFLISALTSVTLVTSYLAAALGKKFPWKIATAGQLFFLVLFSYSFFIKGITGLTVAIGSVVTLAILMRVTASVDWNKIFVKPMKITKTDRHPGLKSD